MERRTLGKDLSVSAIGLGCMGMSHAYGPPADRLEMTELLAQAVDMGAIHSLIPPRSTAHRKIPMTMKIWWAAR